MTALGKQSTHARPYVEGSERRVRVARLACWGHAPVVSEDHERCYLCGRELDQAALLGAYRAALADQATLAFEAYTWVRSSVKRAAA